MVKLGFVLLILTALSGCYYLQSADAPLAVKYYSQAAGYQPDSEPSADSRRDLMILLPGMGDDIDRFADQGLIDQIREAQLPLDVAVVDAHFGYYRNRSFLVRLREDVIEPAMARGYQRLHLGGVSLGGFGSLLYWQDDQTAPLASVSLLTPYVGEPEYYAYRLDSSRVPEKTHEDKNIWPWLENLSREDTRHWYLGRAESDKFYRANTALAGLLPRDNTATVSGGHNWDTWRALWPLLLNKLERDFFSESSDKAL